MKSTPAAPAFLYPLDQFALGVALKAIELGPGFQRQCQQALVDVPQSFRAVDIRLTGAKKIEVGAMQDENLSGTYGRQSEAALPPFEAFFMAASLPQLPGICPVWRDFDPFFGFGPPLRSGRDWRSTFRIDAAILLPGNPNTYSQYSRKSDSYRRHLMNIAAYWHAFDENSHCWLNERSQFFLVQSTKLGSNQPALAVHNNRERQATEFIPRSRASSIASNSPIRTG